MWNIHIPFECKDSESIWKAFNGEIRPPPQTQSIISSSPGSTTGCSCPHHGRSSPSAPSTTISSATPGRLSWRTGRLTISRSWWLHTTSDKPSSPSGFSRRLATSGSPAVTTGCANLLTIPTRRRACWPPTWPGGISSQSSSTTSTHSFLCCERNGVTSPRSMLSTMASCHSPLGGESGEREAFSFSFNNCQVRWRRPHNFLWLLEHGRPRGDVLLLPDERHGSLRTKVPMVEKVTLPINYIFSSNMSISICFELRVYKLCLIQHSRKHWNYFSPIISATHTLIV